MRLVRNIKNLEKYIKLSPVIDTEYDNIITVEHRSNNLKRDYLFVNKLQCKHIPCSPIEMAELCKKLAYKVQMNLYDSDNVLVIGFAETATALANILAENLDANSIYVTVTTREDVPGSKTVVQFEEEHSHAVNQKLLTYDSKNKLNLTDYNYILFVDDEITTGKTILNCINELNKKLGNHEVRYGVASICNWLNKTKENTFDKLCIDEYFILSGEIKDENIKFGNINVIKKDETHSLSDSTKYEVHDFHNKSSSVFREERLGHNKTRTIPHIKEIINLCKDAESIRIIGSEEFMTIPIKLGVELGKLGKDVICHSTTRSKIDVIKDSMHDGEYSGIKKRYKVKSPYEKNRNTYIYNTSEKVDLTIILTDTPDKDLFKEFYESVLSSLNYKETKAIIIRF